MAQYIDKDVLVAEILKLKGKISDSSSYCNGWQHALIMLEAELDTLEVKEVDLNKELSYEDYKSFFEKYPDLSNDWGFEEAWTFAQYFFKLGLKARKGE